MSRICIGLLVPPTEGGLHRPPESLPLGQAALRLREEGVDIVLGEQIVDRRMTGQLAGPGRWEPVTDVHISALHDRFPSQGRATPWLAAIRGADSIPIGNPPSFTTLCRDKLVAQRVLERGGVELPCVEDEPARFAERLEEWGLAFLKPRYGSLGVGVRRVRVGDALPAYVDGLQGPEPALLQKAVPPPAGLAGAVVRRLLQRSPEGSWVGLSPVLRSSAHDPVVNVARGATVSGELDEGFAFAVERETAAVARALNTLPETDWIVEVGIDLCLDDRGSAVVIEINGRPRGRLAELAKLDPGRFQAEHEVALLRPMRRLAALARAQPSPVTLDHVLSGPYRSR